MPPGTAMLHTPFDVLWLLGLGLFFLYTGFRAYRRERTIADTPVSPAVGLALGPVALNGTAHGASLVPSPFSGVPHIYAQMKVWHYESTGRSSSWVVKGTAQGPAGAAFLLHDATGSVPVVPHGCELTATEHEYLGNADQISPEGEAVVQRFGLWWGDPNVKVTETVLPQDSPAYVLGVATEAGRLPDGAVNVAALGAAIAADAPVVAAPAAGKAPFLICTQGPVTLERRLARSTLLQLAGGVLLVLLAVGFALASGIQYLEKTRPANFARAVKNGNVTAVKAAITNTDLNKPDAFGDTPLIRAARAGNVARVHELIAAGADANASDHAGFTALHAAVLARSPQTVKALLDDKVFSDIGDADGNTPLHLAVKENDVVLVRELVAGGESPSSYNNAHHTPLDIARANHYHDVESALTGSPAKH